MSEALIKASCLKPDIRLAQAVSQFEADLSSEQKVEFRNYKTQTIGTPPSLSDVMRLTAEIDRASTSGRCFGPRMTNFLQAVQQFAALGDVIVGGSQNIVACAVWTLVRMSLLSVVVYRSYLEKFSNLFMIVGRSAPRYEKMALLYPQSKVLQTHLLEYFTVVVRICHRLTGFTHKSPWGKYVTALNDSELKQFQADLEVWASSIKEDVNLLMAKQIDQQSHNTIEMKSLLKIVYKSQSYEREIKTKLWVLGLCTKYSHEKAWKQIRKLGKTTLLDHNNDYQDWKSKKSSCTLVYAGKLGSGKSVLLANIIDDLNYCIQNKTIPIAYFFCQHDISESLLARTILGSLARQLLQIFPDLTKAMNSLDETATTLDFDDIIRLLSGILSFDFQAYIIIDGLDECDAAEKEVLIKGLRKLQQRVTINLCLSLRLEPGNTQLLQTAEYIAAKVVFVPDDNPDIKAFIDTELESRLESEKLKIGDPALILEIQDALTKGSQGMFLWVALLLESLCDLKTDEAIQQGLIHLPKSLPEVYYRILLKPEESDKLYQRRILELVLAARRPLRMEELREALSVNPGDPVWRPGKLLNDISSTLASCGGLITFDEEELTIRLAHHSVKQFLLGKFEDFTDLKFTMEHANKTVADIIITYLSYGVFKTQLSTLAAPKLMVGSVTSNIILSTMNSLGKSRNSASNSLALKLLESRKQPGFDVGKVLADASSFFKERLPEEFYFYAYARSFCLQHVVHSSKQEPMIYKLFVKLLKENVVNAHAMIEPSRSLLSWVAENGNEPVIKALLDFGEVNVNLKDGLFGRTPLSWAAIRGHEAVVKLLLNTGNAEVDSRDGSYRTALSWAAGGGHEAVVKLLLDTGKAEVDSMDGFDGISGRTPLSWAAGGGHEAVVKLLLDKGKAYVDSMDGSYRTALSWAAGGGHEAVVRLLLDTGKAYVNPVDESNRIPLSWAAGGGHEAVVRLLLDTGKAKVDSRDRRGETALLLAAKGGHEAVVRLLLDTGRADVDSKAHSGETPLSLASSHGHKGVVELLRSTSVRRRS